ncbi:MAG: DUF6542 domain-containing protein [Jatrophihabitans sp.]
MAGWQALIVLLFIAGVAGLIDYARGETSRGMFNYGVVFAALVAILVVRRSAMFPIVIAPPIVFVLGKAFASILRGESLTSHGGLYDAGTNWFVYGFPAIAGATAVVLLIAGVRLLTNR